MDFGDGTHLESLRQIPTLSGILLPVVKLNSFGSVRFGLVREKHEPIPSLGYTMFYFLPLDSSKVWIFYSFRLIWWDISELKYLTILLSGLLYYSIDNHGQSGVFRRMKKKFTFLLMLFYQVSVESILSSAIQEHLQKIFCFLASVTKIVERSFGKFLSFEKL